MPTETTQSDRISSNDLHNRNCYAFLLASANVSTILDQSLTTKLAEEYDANYQYGNLYTTFLTELEKRIDQCSDEIKIALLNSVFLNKSDLLEDTSKNVVAPTLKESKEWTFSSLASAITNRLNEPENKKKISIHHKQWDQPGAECSQTLANSAP